MRADWTASGACTSGSTAPPRGATRRASGGAATTSTTRAEDSPRCCSRVRLLFLDLLIAPLLPVCLHPLPDSGPLRRAHLLPLGALASLSRRPNVARCRGRRPLVRVDACAQGVSEGSDLTIKHN